MEYFSMPDLEIESSIDIRTNLVKHLFHRRLFVCIDEWLTYVLLLYLYNKDEKLLLTLVIPFAILFNFLGYRSLWLLRKRYGIRD